MSDLIYWNPKNDTKLAKKKKPVKRRRMIIDEDGNEVGVAWFALHADLCKLQTFDDTMSVKSDAFEDDDVKGRPKLEVDQKPARVNTVAPQVSPVFMHM